MAYAQGPYPPPPPILSPSDERDLNVLRTLFYAYAGLLGFSIFAVLAAAVAILLPLLFMGTSSRPRPADLAVVGGFVGIILMFVLLLFVVKLVVMILAGRAISRRTGATLCTVAACLALTNIPLGTALGIYALMTLSKPQIKQALSPRSA